MKRFTAFARSAGRARRGFTLIELIVVVGLVAMLIGIASTGFFGALRQEDATRARNQLRDVLLSARQQACVTGRTQVVVCWNADATIQVGRQTQQVSQGKYAVFASIGNVWYADGKLCVPYGYQRDTLAALTPGTRVISLADPDASRFAVISDSVSAPNKTQDDIDEDESQGEPVSYRYMAGGTEEKVNRTMKIVAWLKSGSPSLKAVDGRIPLAARESQVYNLPAYYAFSRDRTAFVFRPDGSIETEGGSTVSVSHSVPGRKGGQFSVTVNASGEVDAVSQNQ